MKGEFTMATFFDSHVFTWFILPVLIFLARIMDMSLDTLRIVMIGRGRKFTVAFLGFFEVSIWLLVARQVIAHLPNIACFFAYAGGFAAGNYVGMWIEERMASGAQIIRVIVDSDGPRIMEALKARGHGVTSMRGQGAMGSVDIIFSIVQRKEAPDVLALIKGVSPGAFYIIEDVRDISEGFFPPRRKRGVLEFFTRK
jgi:uncharacterized protein YebE (UPF0316 family)